MVPRQTNPWADYSAPHVTVFERKVGDAAEVVIRWRDPVEQRVVQRSAAKLGLLKPNGDPDRKAFREWVRGKSRQIVEQRAQIANGSLTEQPLALDEAVTDYLARFRGVTLKSQRRVIEEFASFVRRKGVALLPQLTEMHLQQWQDRVEGQAYKLAASTRGKWARYVRSFVLWGLRRKQLPRVSDVGMRNVLRVPAASKRLGILWPADVRSMLRAALRHDASERPAFAPFLLASLLSGARLHELLALRWSDVRFEQGCVVIRSTKTDAERVVAWDVSPALGKLLAALKLAQGGDRVFPLERWTYERMPSKLVRRFGAPAGWSLHSLRRTCSSVLGSSDCYGGGSSALLAARRAGHDLATADRFYAHAIPGLPRDARSIEQAVGIVEIADAIVASIGGVAVAHETMAEPPVSDAAQAG